MFQKARLRLTFFYSLLFLFLFWILSIGIYIWIGHFFHEQYEQAVMRQYAHEVAEHDADVNDKRLSTIAETIALNHLKFILLILNGGLFLFVPASAWVLTGRSLKPVEDAHTREKQFVTDVAHDLRTPLTILSSELEVALRKNRSADDYKQLVISNKEEVDRLSLLVSDLLFLARQDAKINHIPLSLVDLTDVIGKVVARYFGAAKQKQLDLTFIPAKDNLVVSGNQIMLEQLFANLIDNAIKYTKHGKITIIAAKQDNVAVVSVKDTGIGISEADQKSIFDRFMRADASRSQIKGYGLGLSIAITIVKIHKGTLVVASRLGNGSMFTVRLPITIQSLGKNQS